MKRINILVISGVSAVILFVILTVLQAKLTSKEATVTAYVSNTNIIQDSKLQEYDYKKVEIPLSLALDCEIITDSKDLDGKYAKEHINKGQLIFKQDVAGKEELKILDAEVGKERIAVKIKSAENAVSYQVKPKDRIHLYFTGKSNVIKNTFSKYGIEFDIEAQDNSLQSKKIISDIEILGIYDEVGRDYYSSEFSGVDTIVIAVDSKNAEMINCLRAQGTFDITR